MADKNNNSLIIGGIVGIGILSALASWNKKRRTTSLRGKTVLITGGSRGLGLVLAREFAAEGARVAICARDAAELTRAETDLREKTGAQVYTKVCDVRNQAEAARLVEDVTADFGEIDVLVNNAGIIQVGALENQTQKDFEDAMQIHFWAPFYTMQAVIPQMRRRQTGRIVNISSIGGKVAVPHLAPYCASKFALVGLSSAMRVELAKENISVTTVCPGLMRTGSHINALFKGQNELEYAWFSLGNALPVSSVSAETAARQIIKAAKNGDAELIISPQAEILAKMNALFPDLTAEISALINQILPAPGGIGTAKATGLESASFVSPSILTTLADQASERNNELKPNESIS